jgi:hypothetical protein
VAAKPKGGTQQRCSVVLDGERCPRQAARRGLCQAHRNQADRKQELRPTLGAHGSKGPREKILVRVSKAAHRALVARARTLELGSPYGLSCAALEQLARLSPQALESLAKVASVGGAGDPFRVAVEVLENWSADADCVRWWMETRARQAEKLSSAA